MLPICAFNETESDLYNGWLRKCEHHAEKIDTAYLFRQYNKLIYNLGGKQMNKPLMENFLANMLEDKNYETAIALKSMLNDLLIYRRDKIIDHFRFKAFPFIEVSPWGNYYAVFNGFFLGESNYTIDVIVNENNYQVQFFDRVYLNLNDATAIANPVNHLLKEVNYLDQFSPSGLRVEKVFTFPEQEDELHSFLTEFINTLKLTVNMMHAEKSTLQS